jgi:hypothetical protein
VIEPPPCADVSRAHHEPLYGTASRVRNWLLVEAHRPWDREPFTDISLRSPITRVLKQAADRFKIRLLLIRRSVANDGPGPACFAVHSGTSRQWIRRCDVDDLSRIDLAAMRQGDPPFVGRPWDRSLYLVCTHSEHDPCCGRYGRAVADELLAHRPEETWECSHVGGDRFAANLVCLPHGLYFGRVPPGSARQIVSKYEEGVIELDHYRGRSCFDPIVQAADILIRGRERLTHIDDLTLTWRRDHAGGEATLGFLDRAGAEHEIRIAARRGSRRRITCYATGEGSPREYRVVFDDR